MALHQLPEFYEVQLYVFLHLSSYPPSLSVFSAVHASRSLNRQYYEGSVNFTWLSNLM